MKKPWSITTTMRNPDRLVGFLGVLSLLDGAEWSDDTQIRFQTMLIQHRVYGYGRSQFYSNLPDTIVKLLDDASREMTYQEAEAIFCLKNYVDPPMRGRQSINSLKKLGFATTGKGKVHITALGKKLITGESDIGEVFLRCFLKWQIPNLLNSGYKAEDIFDVNPFIATLHLINSVNEKELARGKKAIGLSKREFSLFAPSLINYRDIEDHANKVLAFRDMQDGLDPAKRKIVRDRYRNEFAKSFLDTADEETIEKFLSNLKDYGDNAIRYFRLTRYLHIRGGGFYVDLEPRRAIEIQAILENYSGAGLPFDSKQEYEEYMSDCDKPLLPWETKEKLIEIIEQINIDNTRYERLLGMSISPLPKTDGLGNAVLNEIIDSLRKHRSELQGKIDHIEAQEERKLESCICDLEKIFTFDNRPILLEKLSAFGLRALNDAREIKPNYPVGDDNEPTFTAPAGVPDIECYYEKFNAICEVTMLCNRDQWYNEGQPVMRHLRDFENRLENMESAIYCLFIAPSIHRDTLNTFWNAVKYEYEGCKQRIVPITITQFIKILKTLFVMKKENKPFLHDRLLALYDDIIGLTTDVRASNEWLSGIDEVIDTWAKAV
jgi:hypothetical protein